MEFQKRPMKSKPGPIPSKQSSHIKIPNNGIGLLQNAPALVLIRSKADCAIIWTRTIDLASQNKRLNSNSGHHRRRPRFTPMKSAAGILIGDSERSDRASPFGNSQIGQKSVITSFITL